MSIGAVRTTVFIFGLVSWRFLILCIYTIGFKYKLQIEAKFERYTFVLLISMSAILVVIMGICIGILVFKSKYFMD